MINVSGFDKESEIITIEFDNGTKITTTSGEIFDLSNRLVKLGFKKGRR